MLISFHPEAVQEYELAIDIAKDNQIQILAVMDLNREPNY